MAASKSSIVMIGADGNVYRIKTADLAKVAKKVPKAKLSADVQEHLERGLAKHVKAGNGKGVAHILVSKADILTASKADILAASKADILTASKAEILVK